MKIKFIAIVSLLVVSSAIAVLLGWGNWGKSPKGQVFSLQPQEARAENSGFAKGDSFLMLGKTGYASRANTQVDDLDYSKSFSVEALIKIEQNTSYGYHAFIFGKSYTPHWMPGPGIFLGFSNAHYQKYGQSIVGKVNDKTNKTTVSSPLVQGDVYSVMAWDVQSKTLILYINGQEVSRATNTAIISSDIKNTYSMGLGQRGYGNYGTLGANIFFVRLWNREISATEVLALWNNYQDTGQHTLPGSIPATDLKSQWLMDQTSNVSGTAGTTYIKDSVGTNHMEFLGGAALQRQIGMLQAVAPLNGATGVDKTVYLTVEGGEETLGANVVLPLHFSFEIDETPNFNSPSLQQSGWRAHYSQWSPTLKPSTTYYWRAKTKDSANVPQESSWTSARRFQTEGPSVWYVRPRNDSAKYGTEDGTSYENAFNGLTYWKPALPRSFSGNCLGSGRRGSWGYFVYLRYAFFGLSKSI